MAKKKKLLTGLDLDPTAVRAATVSMGSNGLEVVRSASEPLPYGVLGGGEVNDGPALTEALRRLFKDHGTFDPRVRIGIANSRVVVRVINLPPISDPKDLDTAVRYQIPEELPMPLETAVVDYHALAVEEGPDGPRTPVVVVAAQRRMVEDVLGAARAAGLRPEGIDLSAFAIVRALGRTSEDEGSTLYLNLSGLTTVAVADGYDCTLTRVLPDGFDELRQQIADDLQISLDEAVAELTSLDIGSDELGDVRTERVRELARNVVRKTAFNARTSLEFHRAGGRTALSGCRLTGTYAELPGLAPALEAELRLPISIGRLGEAGSAFSAAAGLALAEAA